MKETRTTTHLIGGFAGGLASAVALQPLDLLKTRVQQTKGTTIWQAVVQAGSVKELWRGTLPSAIRTSVGSALYLSSLNVMRTALARRKHEPSNTSAGGDISNSSNLPKLSMHENLATGALARGLVGYITMPITVLKVRYESTLYNYKSLAEAARSIASQEGVRGFFRGFGPTCLRDAPYSGLYVLLYEQMKQAMPSLLPKSFIGRDVDGSFTTSTSTIVNSSSAMLSASLATTITAPFDTIKTRMQLEPARFKTFFSTLVAITSHEHPLKLFSGLSMRLSRKAMSAGIAWGIYEELVKYFM
ncbi:hypothetical protein RNJ44_02017 [Nakaseomyces bracarensis]|uniref:Mitochondrial glycine transporter n=1 Tax=Nakaseomyces bracarensis TaxID=273131 RepID=A0ABR4NMA3_9SACH